MRKYRNKTKKRILSCLIAATLLATSVNYEWRANLSAEVQAAEEIVAVKNSAIVADSYIVDDSIIPNRDLLRALKKIIGGSESSSITFGQLKEYTGDIDLTEYPMINDIKGLGYAYSAKTFDLSALTSVKTIPLGEFSQCKMKKFVMPDTITNIGNEAFKGCEQLEQADIPDDVTVIGRQAFINCESLKEINIPKGIVKIGNQAFSSCTSITTAVIPDGIDATESSTGEDSLNGIGTEVFAGCNSLTSITFGDGMTIIPAGFLKNTTSLASVSIPEKIVAIREEAFSGSGITSIDISANTEITEISNNTFLACTSLSSVKLPEHINRIGAYAFSETNLNDTEFLREMHELTYIGQSAFMKSKLVDAYIPGNVTTIDQEAFFSCEQLENLVIDELEYEVTTLTRKIIGVKAFGGCRELKNVELPTKNENNENVRIVISNRAFENCCRLATINFPLNVESIGDYAFTSCGISVDTKLERVPFSTVNISKNRLFTEENAPEGTVEVIGYALTDGFYVTKPVYVYESDISGKVEDLDTDIEVGDDEYVQEDDGSGDVTLTYIDLNSTKKGNIHVQEFFGLRDIDLSKNENIEIGEGAFEACINLNSVKLPDSLTEIPNRMFANCAYDLIAGTGKKVSYYKKEFDTWFHGLESVRMSDGVTSIGSSAFQGCSELRMNGKVPSSLKSIGSSAFSECENIGGLEMPATLESIGASAFSSCSRIIKKYMFGSRGLLYFDVKSCTNLTYIGSSAFESSTINKFVMNDAAKATRINDSAFYDCQYFTQLNVSNSVKKIGRCALAGCLRFTSLSISDHCNLDANLCMGAIGAFDYDVMPDVKTKYTVLTTTNKIKYYYYTNRFVTAIMPIKDELTVAENSVMEVPLYTISVDSTNSSFKDVIIGEDTYVWDNGNGVFTNAANAKYLKPSQFSVKSQIEGNEYEKSLVVSAYGLGVEGVEAKEDIRLMVNENIVFKVAKDRPEVITLTPSVTYKVDVTKNPCVAINADNVYINQSSTTGVTIEPEFVPAMNIGGITDVVTWDVISGDELITIKPSEDGKTVTVKSNNAGYGTATVSVVAGSITKNIYVYVCAPSSGITLSSTKESVILGNAISLSATQKYDTALSSVCDLYPDSVKVTSSNESVARVKNIVVNGRVTDFVVESVGAGKATITVTSKASGKSASCVVTVGATDTKLTVMDSEGNEVIDGTPLSLRNKVGATLYYSLDDSSLSSSIAYVSTDPSIASVSINTTKKTINIVGTKKGSTTITVYPSIGTPEDNGIDIEVQVEADIERIGLGTERLNEGEGVNIVQQVVNTLGQSVRDTSDSNIAEITDNIISFESSDESKVTVDNYGNVYAKAVTGTDSVTITCNVYRKNEIILSVTSTVIVNKKGQVIPTTTTTTTPNISNYEPEVPTGIDISYASDNSVYLDVDINPNGQQVFIYIDQMELADDNYEGGRIELKGLSTGQHFLVLRGVINGKASAFTEKKIFNVGPKPTTTPVVTTTTSEKITTTTSEKITTPLVTTTSVTTTKGETTVRTTTTQIKTTSKIVTTNRPTTKKPTQNIKVGKAKISKAIRNKNNKKAKITIKKISGVTKYEIAYSTSSKFTKKTTRTITSSKISVSISKLKPKKKYYVKVRAYKLVNKVKYYGKWSTKKVLKVKKK